jgi:hypothetical protein
MVCLFLFTPVLVLLGASTPQPSHLGENTGIGPEDARPEEEKWARKERDGSVWTHLPVDDAPLAQDANTASAVA